MKLFNIDHAKNLPVRTSESRWLREASTSMSVNNNVLSKVPVWQGFSGTNLGPVPRKVLDPFVTPRIEKANNLSCVRIKPCNVRPLEAIAVDTGQGKIFRFGFASMLPSDDVIYLEWGGVKHRRQLTIFATILCALPNLPNEISVQYVYWVDRCKARRPFDCIRASKLLTCR